MTVEKVKEAARWCTARVIKSSGTRMAQQFGLRSLHLLYMCEQIAIFMEEGRREKAMRWLGFVQGALWSYDAASIDEMKEVNRGDENG